MLSGSMVALVTPMQADNSVDFTAFKQLLDWQMAEGTDGIVVLGTTGECPTITAQERTKLIQISVKTCKDRVPVIIGTGSNSTQHTIEMTLEAKALGADAALVVTPYYNKPTQAGLYQHYTAVVEATQFPTILYNVPGRTGCDLLPETVARLAVIPYIVAIKESVFDRARYKQLVALPDLSVLSGDDVSTLALIKAGGDGVISVAANVVPGALKSMVAAARSGDWSKADGQERRLQPLFDALFVESNPIPVKWALHHLGRIDRGIRLPLTWLFEEHAALIQQVLTDEEKSCVI